MPTDRNSAAVQNHASLATGSGRLGQSGGLLAAWLRSTRRRFSVADVKNVCRCSTATCLHYRHHHAGACITLRALNHACPSMAQHAFSRTRSLC